MVTTRSSNRLAKKAKLESDMVVEIPVMENQDNGFQEALSFSRTRAPEGRQLRSRKLPISTRSTTRSLTESTCAATSSSSSFTTEQADIQSEEPSSQTELTQEEEEEVSTQDIVFLTRELLNPSPPSEAESSSSPSSQIPLMTEEEAEEEHTENIVVPDIGSLSDSSSGSDTDSSSDSDPVPERRGRRRRLVIPRPRIENYKKTEEKVNIQHPELRDIWKNIENIPAPVVTPIEQPAELSLSLLPFQRYGVGWMIQQEAMDSFNGGILADEMGMGKTIQTIALLLSDKKKPNLVVAPTVAIIQWKNEIEKHTNNALSVYVYHGATRSKDISELKNYDVVLTTYSILEFAFRRQESGVKRKSLTGDYMLVKEKSLLHKIKWHRIILDEAHNVKDRSSNTARSVFNLNGRFKWSLTGTPLQNRVGELYSLIRFMRADPFAYYYCKSCPCKELSWKFSNLKECDSCHHTPMSHVCWWNNEVLKPIQIHGYVGDGRIALKKLRLLLDKIMLRRTKIECADDLGLPPRTVIVRRDVFTEEEEDVYTSLYSDVARTFTTYVEAGTVLNNYANIFELLMKMRQCADHPDLVTKKSTDNKQLICMLCNDLSEDPITALCKHVFCRECCVQYFESFDDSIRNKPRCPSCYAEFSVDLTQASLDSGMGSNGNYTKSSIVNRINMDKWRSSTKIEALVEELSNLRREDKTIKSIVFSQFVNFLDLVYWRLSRAGFECIRLDGTMSPSQRDAAIQHFSTKPTVTVFLISLKAGGVALNLTEASRVFICDPWWNPAMDRIHRLGQHRPIRITRLIIENSIESRIVQLQEKKTALVNSTVGKMENALDKLSIDDLRFLFVM
ncbi:SNF2 family N-terminal domain-containing protein [Pilaira anomala]|nr:SNF2 family N-terminal domain-containing protein [Pilaira anomala]